MKTQSAKMYQMDTVNQNSEYPVSQNAPKCTQLTKIVQNNENPVTQNGPK